MLVIDEKDSDLRYHVVRRIYFECSSPENGQYNIFSIENTIYMRIFCLYLT